MRGSTAAPLPLLLAADRSSLCAIAARCRAAAPDCAAAGALTADRSSAAARARRALRTARSCAPACDGRCSRARLCAARPPRRSRSCSPLIAARSVRSRLAAAPPRLTARRRARSPPTDRRRLLALVVLCAQHARAHLRATSRCSRARLCAARPPRRSRSCSPLIAARSVRSRLAAAPPRLTARRRARSPPTDRRRLLALVVLGAQHDRAHLRATSRCSRARLMRGSTAAPLPLLLAADRSSLCAIAARCRAAAPDCAAAGALTADRSSAAARARRARRTARSCAPACDESVLSCAAHARLDRRAAPAPARR